MATVTIDRAVAVRLHGQARADRWGLSPDEFAEALEASAAHAVAADPSASRDVVRYLQSLHLEDLALACACGAGREAAWEHFIKEHRPIVYRAAEAIDRSGGARELADSIYGDLFGLTSRAAERRSLFRYFHGRSSLATWLRAVLAQRHLDRLRAGQRLDPLPDEESPAAIPSAAPAADPSRDRFVTAMRLALGAAVAGLASRDRLRLGCYYAENLTLAEIGRLLGEHEATASRHLARTRRDVRAAIEAELRRTYRFGDDDIAQCFESVMSDSGTLDLADVLGSAIERKIAAPDRSKG